jgi:hypothetical protein
MVSFFILFPTLFSFYARKRSTSNPSSVFFNITTLPFEESEEKIKRFFSRKKSNKYKRSPIYRGSDYIFQYLFLKIGLVPVDIKMEEQESGEHLITVTLPKVTLDDPEVDIDSLKYMFQEKKANDGTVSGEAYKACIQDIKEKSKSETMIYKTAQQNAENTIKGLVEPFVRNAETSEDHYKVKIITAEENAK